MSQTVPIPADLRDASVTDLFRASFDANRERRDMARVLLADGMVKLARTYRALHGRKGGA